LVSIQFRGFLAWTTHTTEVLWDGECRCRDNGSSRLKDKHLQQEETAHDNFIPASFVLAASDPSSPEFLRVHLQLVYHLGVDIPGFFILHISENERHGLALTQVEARCHCLAELRSGCFDKTKLRTRAISDAFFLFLAAVDGRIELQGEVFR
jgi:hypothetical protein